jgi:hypothetical protein
LEEMYLELALNTISGKGQSGVKTKNDRYHLELQRCGQEGDGHWNQGFTAGAQVDLLGLQETMKKKYTEKFFRTIDPSRSYAWQWLPSKGRSGGSSVALRWKN